MTPRYEFNYQVQEIYTEDPLGDRKVELDSWNLKIGRNSNVMD